MSTPIQIPALALAIGGGCRGVVPPQGNEVEIKL